MAGWKTTYRSKLTTAEKAVAAVGSGEIVGLRRTANREGRGQHERRSAKVHETHFRLPERSCGYTPRFAMP